MDVGVFQLFKLNFSLVPFCLLTFRRCTRKVIITRSWLLPTSAPGKLLVLAKLIHAENRFFIMMQSVWWPAPFGPRHVILLDVLCGPKVFASNRSLALANSRSLRPLSLVSVLQCSPQVPSKSFDAPFPIFEFQSPCTIRMSFFLAFHPEFLAADCRMFRLCYRHSLLLGHTLARW